MRIARFAHTDGSLRYGAITGETSARLIEGDICGAWAQTDQEVETGPLAPPVDPPNIFCIGLNYLAHAKEGGKEVPAEPLIFMKPTTAVIEHGGRIRLPASAPHRVDFEAELAVIIGRRARDVSPDDALKYVLGYTCANDVSARDLQKRDGQWARAKGCDTFCPLGPCFVPAADLNPGNVTVESRLNGKVMQSSETADMIFPVPFLISYLSRHFTLLPGTVVCTGTPAGVGFARDPAIYLADGDTISVSISGIGTLTNTVEAAPI